MKKTFLFCLCLIMVVSLLGCNHNDTGEIVTTTKPIWEFTSFLCRDTGMEVTALITENVSCLHDYTLQVSQMRKLENAQVVIINGGGLESFIPTNPLEHQTYIDCSVSVPVIDTCNEPDHDHHHDTDSHFWLSPACAKIMVNNIFNGLTVKYPEHKDTFQANYSQLIKKLNDLESYGLNTLKDLSFRRLITFHDGFSHFAQAFDLEILKSMEEEAGSEASAVTLKELSLLIDNNDLPAIFTEKNGSTSAAQILARENNVSIYSLDMALSGGYFDAMYSNIDTIKEALG